MTNLEAIQQLSNELLECNEIDLITSPKELERFSRDFYDYSPILFERLKNCCSEVVVRPKSLQAVSLIASICAKRKISLTTTMHICTGYSATEVCLAL